MTNLFINKATAAKEILKTTKADRSEVMKEAHRIYKLKSCKEYGSSSYTFSFALIEAWADLKAKKQREYKKAIGTYTRVSDADKWNSVAGRNCYWS